MTILAMYTCERSRFTAASILSSNCPAGPTKGMPQIIVCLGRIAAAAIIDKDFKITKEHGSWYERKGFWITATYHPSALLRDETKKRPAWEDFKAIRAKLDEVRKGNKETDKTTEE